MNRSLALYAFCRLSRCAERTESLRAKACRWLLLAPTLAPAIGCVIPLSSSSSGTPDAATQSPDGPIVSTPGSDASIDGQPVGSLPGDGRSTASDAPSLPTGGWKNVTGNLANMPSECGNLSFLSAKPDEDMLIAGIALDGLWAFRNGVGDWAPLGLASDASATITNRTSFIAYDPQNHQRFWESGIYNAGGVFETSDDGATFTQLGDVTHVDLVSIDFTDPNRQTLLAGGHEQAQTVWRSVDGGKKWANVGAGLPASTACSFPLVIGSMTYLVGCNGEGGGPIGIYRTVDGGGTWASTTTLGGAAPPLVASDGSIYWASPNSGVLARSTDQGMTWSNAGTGTGAVGAFRPVELPDKRIAAIGPQFGTQSVVISTNHGATWTPATQALPFPDVFGLTYSSQERTFYVWHFTCAAGTIPVPPDAVMGFSFDYTTQ